MILHIDMDAFFASIEQRDNPGLRNQPVIVSGASERSVVSTASYEARKFGIHSAMPVFQAKQRCPGLIIVPGNMKKYLANSKKIMEILLHFSPVVEQVSIDEAYMDICGCEKLFGAPEKMAASIKNAIENEVSLTCSIGISPVKFLSKIASDMNKPNGLTFIHGSDVQSFIDTLPIRKIPGIGKKALVQMQLLQIQFLGDIKKISPSILVQKFGKMGHRLIALSNGIDLSKVETHAIRKSISSETTLSRDIFDFERVKQVILDRSQSVGTVLRKKNLVCETIFIKLKFSDFSQITRSKTLDSSICSSTSIFKEAMTLYTKVLLKKKIRLVGVGVTSLKHKNAPVQMQWLQDTNPLKKRWESVDSAMDSIAEKFGSDMIKKASLTRTEPWEETR